MKAAERAMLNHARQDERDLFDLNGVHAVRALQYRSSAY